MKLFHAESATGKVHLASDGGYKDGKVDPYCNQRQWIGDYWGKDWKVTDKPVTCKRCLASAIKEGIIKPEEPEEMRCPNCNAEAEQISHEAPAAHLHVGVVTYWCPECGTICKAFDLDFKLIEGKTKVPKNAKVKKTQKLTVGCRARFKPGEAKAHSWSEYAGHECLIDERSSHGDFSVMILGKGPNAPLIKKDSNTVLNQVAWVNEDGLEFVDADFETNMDFIDWYSEHQEDFCGDCGAWFPENGRINHETDEESVCPNESCPGRLFDSGHCPYCSKPPKKMVKFNDEDECPECGFNTDLRW